MNTESRSAGTRCETNRPETDISSHIDSSPWPVCAEEMDD
jgi:hypothetical protein